MKSGFLSTVLRKNTVAIIEKQWLLCFVFSEACSLVITLLLHSRVPEEAHKNQCKLWEITRMRQRERKNRETNNRRKREKGKEGKKTVIVRISVLDSLLTSS